MRALAASTLFVCLFAAGGFSAEVVRPVVGAAGTEVGQASRDWTTVHNAGLEAGRAGRRDEELQYFRESWPLAVTTEQQAVSAEEIGFQLHQKAQEREAREWLEKSRALCLTIPGTHHLSPVDTILADVVRTSGDYAGAESLWREAIATHPDNNIQLAAAQLGLADLLREEGRVKEAAPLFAKTAPLSDIGSRQHVDALLGLADIDRGAGAWEASICEWNEAIEYARRTGDTLSEGVGLRGLGDTYLDSGSPARAEPLFRRALKLFESNAAAPPEQQATVLKSLGTLYASENKLAMAEEMFSKAIAIDSKVLGEDHPQVAQMMESLSWVYAERGSFEKARELCTRATNVMANTFGTDSLPSAGALASRAFVEVEARNLNEAAGLYAQALGIARHHPDYSRIRIGLIQRYKDVLKALHRNQEAGALNAEARLISNNLKVSPLR